MIALMLAAAIAATTPQDPALAQELQAMEAADQADPVDWSHYQAVQRANTARLTAIVTRYGWPGIHLVGARGSDAAWLIAQNSNDPALQARCLALLEDAVKREDASPKDLAYLTDRVLLNQGKPQRYGTQFHVDSHGESTLEPVEDATHLDARRKAVGLPSVAAQQARVDLANERFMSQQATRVHDLPALALHDELLALKAADAAEGFELGRVSTAARIRFDAMRAILSHGWPKRAEVGQDGLEAARWMVLRGDLDLKRQALPLLDAASQAGEAPREWWASTFDDLQAADHGTQRYGTLMARQNGRDVLSCKLEDPAHVDELRASVGLPPLPKGLGVYQF